jgi:ATP/ADP translocase
MFEEIPEPSKVRSLRKQAWLWIGSSIAWLLFGAGDIARHKALGWVIVVAWVIILLIWIRRLVASYGDYGQKESN